MAASPVARNSHIKNIRAAVATAIVEVSSTRLAPFQVYGSSKWVEEQDAAIEELQVLSQKLHIDLLRARNAMIRIVSLPFEVLSEIFSYGTFDSAFLFSSVCHAWRTAVLENPRLWNHLPIHSLYPKLLPIVIPRSAEVPLHVYVAGRGADLLHGLSLASRIQSLYFRDHVGTSSLISGMTNLESLHVSIVGTNRQIPTFSSLRHLSITSQVRLPQELPAQIKTLHFHEKEKQNGQFFLEFICKFSHLEELSLFLHGPPSTDATIPDNFHLPSSLQRFRLHTASAFYRTLLLSALTGNIRTNIHILPLFSSFANNLSSCVVPLGTSLSIWVNLPGYRVLYKRRYCVYKLGLSDPTELDSVPNLVQLHTVQMLHLTQRTLERPIDMTPFTRLVRLVIESWHPQDLDHAGNSVTIIDEKLVHCCPLLAYIGLTYVSIRNAEHTIPILFAERGTISKRLHKFLSLWIDATGSKFQMIEVDDETRASIWPPIVQNLSSLVERFTIGPLSIDTKPPSLPEFRSFGAEHYPTSITRL